MRNQIVLMATALILTTAVHAQSASAPQTLKSDTWPAKTGSSIAPLAEGTGLPRAEKKGDVYKSPFKFKDGKGDGPMGQPPPSAHDKAAVMGEDRAWQNGRPPVDCAMTPQDPTCH